MTKGKLLLTSSGITNDSIQQALVDLLGKPISESNALFVPTAIYAYPQGIKYGWQVIKSPGELGWKALGVLELTALPSLPKEVWLPQIKEVDAIIVGGGNKFYLTLLSAKNSRNLTQRTSYVVVFVKFHVYRRADITDPKGRFFANTMKVSIYDKPDPTPRQSFTGQSAGGDLGVGQNASNSLLSVLARYGQTPYTVFAQGQ